MAVFFAVPCLPTQAGVFRIGYCRCMVLFVFSPLVWSDSHISVGEVFEKRPQNRPRGIQKIRAAGTATQQAEESNLQSIDTFMFCEQNVIPENRSMRFRVLRVVAHGSIASFTVT